MGIASLVLGILAIIVCWVPCVGVYALVPGVIGVILGAVGLKKAKKTGEGKGLAIAGLVLSIVSTAFAAYWAFVLGAAGAAAAESSGSLSEASEALSQASSAFSEAASKLK